MRQMSAAERVKRLEAKMIRAVEVAERNPGPGVMYFAHRDPHSLMWMMAVASGAPILPETKPDTPVVYRFMGCEVRQDDMVPHGRVWVVPAGSRRGILDLEP